MLNQVPAADPSVSEVLSMMAQASLQLARHEVLAGKEKAYRVACGKGRCAFRWKRASDGALALEASYDSSEPQRQV